jgi:hypothetical protein
MLRARRAEKYSGCVFWAAEGVPAAPRRRKRSEAGRGPLSLGKDQLDIFRLLGVMGCLKGRRGFGPGRKRGPRSSVIFFPKLSSDGRMARR